MLKPKLILIEEKTFDKIRVKAAKEKKSVNEYIRDLLDRDVEKE